MAAPSLKRLPGQRPRRQARSGQQQKGQRDRDELPGHRQPQRRAQHPGQRRIKDKARLARAPVGARGPMRIENSMPPTVQAIEPRGQMKVEVVAAGVAARELRRNGHGRGEEHDGWAGKAARAGPD